MVAFASRVVGSGLEMSANGRLLVVDDEPATRWALERALGGWRFLVCSVNEVVSGVALTKDDFDAVLVARVEPEERIRELLRGLRAQAPHVPVILLEAEARGSAFAVRTGAFDCLTKPLDPDAVVLALQRALAWRRLRLENERLESVVEQLRRREERAVPLLAAPPCTPLSCVVGERLSLQELEDRYVDAVLRLTGGNKVRAAEILGIHRRTIYRRAERRQSGPPGNGRLATKRLESSP